MRPLAPSLIVISLALILSGCGPDSAETDRTEQEALSSDTLVMDPGELKMSAEMLCVDEKNAICEYGIRVGEKASFVELGDYIGNVLVEEVGGVAEDSIENQGGYVWVTRTIQFPGKTGKLVLEGNFIDDRLATDSLIQESTINRIRILSSDYRTPKGLGIGSAFSEILNEVGEEEVGLVHIPDFGFVDIQIGQSHIHYLITDQFLSAGAGDKIEVNQIPGDLSVEMIVVM